MGSKDLIQRMNLDRDYDEIPWLRSALVLVPSFGIGSAIDVALATEVARKRNERLDSFLAELKQQLALLESTSLDADFFRSDEGVDLVVNAIQKSLRTRHKQKHLQFARIVARASATQDYLLEDPEIFMAIIGELPVRYFEMLEDYRQIVMTDDYDRKDIVNEYIQMQGGNADATTLLQIAFPEKYSYTQGDFARIAASGLIKERVGPYVDYSGGAYGFTDLYVRLRAFLTSPPHNDE